ncbi:MAG: AAA family ATPase [Vicinamibacterales bacterium]
MTLSSPLVEAAPVTSDGILATTNALESEITRVVVGQDRLVKRLLTALFASIPYSITRAESRAGCGHVLLEGVPGVAKTLLVTTVAHVISATFQRIQLAPDLLPSDIVGSRIYDAATATFRTERGPIFANIVLADEINRATPKTQSALLEAMQERQVTIAEQTYRLDDPFWVLATQNPVEQEGVYVLPEAQLDRFSMMLKVGYPSPADELAMLKADFAKVALTPRLTPSQVGVIRDFIRAQVHVDDRLREYIIRLGQATRAPATVGRPDLAELLAVGLSPRSYQHLQALARTNAFLHHGRLYVLPGDIKEVFCDMARHRVARTIRAQAEAIDPDTILGELLTAVPIP